MSRVKKRFISGYNLVEKGLLRIDQMPLWWLGIIIAVYHMLFWEMAVCLKLMINWMKAL